MRFTEAEGRKFVLKVLYNLMLWNLKWKVIIHNFVVNLSVLWQGIHYFIY